MRLAYADPPYLGCAHLYPEHPDADLYDDPEMHELLMAEMDRDYDGWAFSLSSTSLQILLPRAPQGIRVAAWVKPFATFRPGVRCAYAWEPVFFKPGRDKSKDGAPLTRDWLSRRRVFAREVGKGNGGPHVPVAGAKPPEFCRWVADLLGYIDGDELVDLFPGTGVMGATLAQAVLQ